jgi:hypothetical protein
MNSNFYSATEIQAMVRNMDDSKRRHKALKETNMTEYLRLLTEENQTLHFNYPSIFMMHAEDKLDATFFYMLNQKRRVEKGDITEDQASREVGQRLYNRWVSPVLNRTDTPNTESYDEYYKKLTKNK